MRRVLITLLLLVLASLAWSKASPNVSLNLSAPATAGIASWYGTFHQGRRMSNGFKFDRHMYTCASRTYILGTVLLVRFPKKGTFVRVVVTDHGPYKHPGRVLDLSEQAAITLGLKPYGLGRITIEPVHLFTGGYNGFRRES